MNIFSFWQVNLILFLVFIVGFFQFYRLAVKNNKDEASATITLQLLAAFSALALFPFFPIEFPSNPKVWILLVIATVFYALSDKLQTPTRKNLEVSVVAIVGQLSTVFLMIYGVILFKDPVVLTKIIGAIFILAGNVLLVFKQGAFHVNKYIWFVALGALSYATAVSIDIGTSVNFNLPIYIFFTFLFPSIFLMILERRFLPSVKKELTTGATKYLLLTGLCWGWAVFFSLRSFQLGTVSTVVPLQATAVLLNVLVAYFFLGEKQDEWKKILAAIIVIAGIILTVQ